MCVSKTKTFIACLVVIVTQMIVLSDATMLFFMSDHKHYVGVNF